MNEPIEDLPLFLAHALALERESAERYRELAGAMEQHNNTEASRLFARLAVFGDLHADEVAEHAENLTLPKLAPWEYRWPDPEGPETQPYEHGHYQLTVPEALAYAHQNESRGKAFYELVAQETQSAVVKELAEEFVEEEAEHVRLLEEWIARTPAESVGEDPDPPNVVA